MDNHDIVRQEVEILRGEQRHLLSLSDNEAELLDLASSAGTIVHLALATLTEPPGVYDARSLVSRTKMFKVGSLRVDMGNAG